jgi:hypothetical protein
MQHFLHPRSILTGYTYAGLVAGTGLAASVHWYLLLAGKTGGWLSLWFLSSESLAMVLATGAVGFCWGVVHLGMRSAAWHLAGDQNRLDYCDFKTLPDSTR